MEGTVTIKVDDYDEFKRYEEFYRAERTIIYQNCCTGKTYFGKAEPSEVIQELKKELEEEQDYSNGIRQNLKKLEEENNQLKEQCKDWQITWTHEKNKTFFQKLFGS